MQVCTLILNTSAAELLAILMLISLSHRQPHFFSPVIQYIFLKKHKRILNLFKMHALIQQLSFGES